MTYVIKKLKGMNRSSGELLDDEAHIRQSLLDILTTPVGTRVMRREYGSFLAELLDKPMNDKLMMQLYAAVAIAVMTYEPRIVLDGVQLLLDNGGRVVFTLSWHRAGSKDKQRHTFDVEVLRR